MKLELQAIAKAAKTIKFNGVKETLILENKSGSLDFKMESPLEDDVVLFPPKGSYSKAKITLFIIMNLLLLLQS
jgi:hypothetical protein